MKTLLVIKSGYPLPLRMPAYREFFRLGWRVVVVDKLINQSIRFADDIIIHEMDNLEELAEIILRKVGKPDGILTFNDSAFYQTSVLAKYLGLKFLSEQVAENAVNKLAQKRIFNKNHIPTPNWKQVRSTSEVAECLDQWGKVVLKPIDRSASAGVFLIKSKRDIEDAFTNAVKESISNQVYVEEYVEGPEISIESFSIDGIQKVISVTDKVTTKGPTFVELGHTTPTTHRQDVISKVKEIAVRACESLDLNYGACHTEIKLTSKGPLVIEVNPRLPGDCIVDLINVSKGINLYNLYGRLAMGEQITDKDTVTKMVPRGAAIRFLPSIEGKVLLDAHSNLIKENPPWLIDLSVIHPLGTQMPKLDSNAGRIAYAIATGEDGRSAMKNAEKAINSITVRFKEV